MTLHCTLCGRLRAWRRQRQKLNTSIYALLGGPGAGKDTQAKLLGPALDLPVISTGDLCRQEIKTGTSVGKLIEQTVKSGKLVPDEVIAGLLRNVLEKPEYSHGYILNGFPRTSRQAVFLDELLKKQGSSTVKLVIFLEVPEPDLLERLSLRRICSNRSCGQSYNLKFKPPAAADICDACGSALYQRADDQPETIRQRIQEYKAAIQPLADYYRSQGRLCSVVSSNELPPAKVAELVLAAIRKTTDS